MPALRWRCDLPKLALDEGSLSHLRVGTRAGRERSDFWIGAYVFNLVAGEVLAIGIPIVWIIASSPHQPWTAIEIVAAALCVALPFLFFPFSRTLWLAWDLSFRPVEPGDTDRLADVNAPRRLEEK
jgi:hypothetical protein